MNPATKLGAAAALLLALAPQSAAAALTQSSQASGAQAASGVAAADGPGNVSVVVPASAIAPGDGLDGVLRHGQTYRAEFVVWVAPNAAKATLVLHASGAVLRHCTAARLRPGATSTVMCLVRTNAHRSVNAVSTEVVVQTSNFGTFSRTFTHALTG